jgi:methyl coenzyme M reductase subunit D
VNGTAQGKITVTDAGKFGGIGTFDERLIVMAGEKILQTAFR